MSPIVRAAESSAALVLSRLSIIAMPFFMAAVIWLGQHYLDQRFDEVRTTAMAAALTAGEAANAVSGLNARVDVIQANMANSAADRTDFQNQITHQVEKLTDVVTATSNQVAAISATLNVGSHVASTSAMKGPIQ